MQTIKKQFDPKDRNIVIAEDLCDDEGNFWSLTLGKALDKIVDQEHLIYCQYEIDMEKDKDTKLLNFIGWTETKVIFCVRGMFYQDSFLDYVLRNPPA